MLATNWDDLMLFWNGVFNENHTTHKQMLKVAYKEFNSLKELALKFDISPETLRQKFKKEGIEIRKPGSG